MKIILNSILPLKGYKAITLWPFIFVRKNKKDKFDKKSETHEYIHGKQQKELFLLLFFIWYGIEWFIRLLVYRNHKSAYYNISFEQEAYLNQHNESYLDKRKCYNWIKYIFKRSFE